MPIYEYQCNDCGHELEKLQRMSEDPLLDCPDCGEPSLKKLISAVGFRLKGSGWYETDFKTGKRKNVAKADSSGEKKSAEKSSSSGSSDSKAKPVTKEAG